MKSSVMILATVLLGATALQPASAAGLLGISSSAGKIGVSGVATVSATSANSGTRVDSTALGGGGSTINVGLGSVVGGDSNVGVTLPGGDNSSVDGPLSDTVNSVNRITDNDGTASALLGDTGLTGSHGGVGAVIGGDGGLLGTDAVGSGTDGGLGGDGRGASGGGFNAAGANGGNLASLLGPSATSAACRRNTAALGQLLRTPYGASAAARWSHASGVQVVKVPVCAQIRRVLGRALAANANISRMQQMAEADPLIGTSLVRSGASARHVLGVGQSNNGVTVYIY